MAKKTRIDKRGKIRSIVKRWHFPNNKPHWSITKRASVWRRRRIIDDVWLDETITLSDAVTPHLQRFVSSSIVPTDAININDQKVILNSITFADSGGIVKNFQAPSNASSATVSDSIGLELGTLLSIFNMAKINDTLFNAIGHDQHFITDSISVSELIQQNLSTPKTESVSIGESIGFELGSLSSIFNVAKVNDTLFNSIGHDQHFIASSLSPSDSVSLNASNALSDSTSVSDSIGFDFLKSSRFNVEVINLSQFNS